MDPRYAAVHAEEEGRHWWFLGRRAVILAEMARRLPRSPRRLAEVGCGSGGLLPWLARFGSVIGVEADPALLEMARGRGLPVRRGRLPDALGLAPGEIDVACLFDVLEHVDDEARALAAVRAALAADGLLVLTVPAYAWLWSRHDEFVGHRRRYGARRLRRVVEAAGFRVERLTYFNALLAGPIILTRLVGRVLGRDSHDLVRPAAPINRALAAGFALEARLLGWTAFPFGISLLCVARRVP